MIFALRSVFYLMLLIVFWFGLGRAFSRWLAPHRDSNPSQHALNGFALATLGATLGYYWGVPLSWTFRCLALVSVGGCLRHILTRTPSDPPKRGRNDLWILLVGGILLVTPLAIGGLQFSLFHSNQYDALNYLQSAAARLTYTHREIATAGPAQFLQNPLLVIAHYLVATRPAIVDSLTLTDGLAPGNLHLLAPGFLTGILILAIPALARIAEQLGASPGMAGLIGVAIVTGFWGQYIVDCDAWSLIGALPLTLAVFNQLGTLLDPSSLNRSTPAGLALPAAALLLVYPEQFCFLAPSIGFSAFWHLHHNGQSGGYRSLFKACGIMVLLAAPGSADLWLFIAGQLSSAAHADHSTLTWAWALLLGNPQTAPIWLTALRAPVGMLGIYLPWLDYTMAGVDSRLILSATFGICIAVAAAQAARCALRTPSTRPAIHQLLIFTGLHLTQSLAIGLLTDPWPAAKAMSYAFPWGMLLAFTPLIIRSSKPILRAPAWLLICLQLALACWRPVVAANRDGRGYPEPYPTADLPLKAHRRWDTNGASRLLANTHRVRIDVPDIWLEYYAMLCVQAQGRAFVKTGPIRQYYDMTPVTLGEQDVSSATDGLVFVEYDPRASTFALGFSAEGKVAWSGSRPFTITRVITPAPLESWRGVLSWWDSAEIEVQGDTDGSAVMDLLLRRHPALIEEARPVVTMEVNGQPARTLIVGPIQAGTVQGIMVPLSLKKGRNSISIRTGGTPSVPTVGFSNPRFTLSSIQSNQKSPD